MQTEEIDDHDGGLAVDLKLIGAQLVARRRALAWLGLGGASALVAACGGGGSSSSGSSTTTTASTADASSTSSTVSTSNTTSSSSASNTTSSACVSDPQATSGPYPADGTNTSQGSTSDILTASGVVRSNIRQSFISGTDTAPGADMTITISLVNTNNGCAALEGYAIYLWHCDGDGNYSLYSAPTESYLRGVQVTDSNGQVTFETIFPACYSGRWPHIHFEVYSSVSAATKGTNAVLTSQFPMPHDIALALYDSDSTYSASVSNLASVSLTTDNVFSAFSSAQLAAMTPTITGSASAGYTASATIGLAV